MKINISIFLLTLAIFYYLVGVGYIFFIKFNLNLGF